MSVSLRFINISISHSNTTKAVIKTRVMGYGLPSSGTRVALLDRLRSFSVNRDEWIILFEPTKRRKRGVHTGRKGNSLSSQQIQSQFGGEDTNVTLYQSKKGIDRRQIQHGTDLRPINGAVLTSHIDGESQDKDIRSDKATVEPQGDSEEDTLALTRYVRCFQRSLFNCVDEVEDKIDQMLRLHTSTSPSVPPETAAVLIPPRYFAYDKSQLRGPPLIHFSRDIERLCCEWESSDLLTVNGRGIPIKYWGEFFKKSKTRSENSAWDSIKVEWGNWKFIAEEWQCFPSADAFRGEYSNATTQSRLTYQQILDRLTLHRKENAAQDAADA
ncbi:uncharacterized protein F5147DRAFT_660488 [Suillus discolor]|uniref:SAP domain-containing protein n=1 Tax=Suillus discolor TaxID=1912936 RepID=A0A9P7EQ75_9AGAM|nr:uncharacterized protein F5147DRAFT_660488 [Suillus discolor]KAG2082480.1 hypothetical protein F5147DRAFT_660488 [Suillus discolor]